MATRRKKQKIKYSIKKQRNKYRRAVLGNIRVKRGGYYGNSSEPGIEQEYGIPHPRPLSPIDKAVEKFCAKIKDIMKTIKHKADDFEKTLTDTAYLSD